MEITVTKIYRYQVALYIKTQWAMVPLCMTRNKQTKRQNQEQREASNPMQDTQRQVTSNYTRELIHHRLKSASVARQSIANGTTIAPFARRGKPCPCRIKCRNEQAHAAGYCHLFPASRALAFSTSPCRCVGPKWRQKQRQQEYYSATRKSIQF